MERNVKRLSEAEFSIMRVLWDAQAPMTSADIISSLEQTKWATTTVLNFLGRLVSKGFLSTRKQGKRNVYSVLIERETYLNQESALLFERFYSRSLTQMVETLLQSGAIEEDDLRELHLYLGKKLGLDEQAQAQDGKGRWRNWYKRYFHT